MEWHKKFKVGQEVKVTKKIQSWDDGIFGTSWDDRYMDKTIGRVYKIKKISPILGYQLLTENDFPLDSFNYWYPVESLEAVITKGQQLTFDFME